MKLKNGEIVVCLWKTSHFLQNNRYIINMASIKHITQVNDLGVICFAPWPHGSDRLVQTCSAEGGDVTPMHQLLLWLLTGSVRLTLGHSREGAGTRGVPQGANHGWFLSAQSSNHETTIPAEPTTTTQHTGSLFSMLITRQHKYLLIPIILWNKPGKRT